MLWNELLRKGNISLLQSQSDTQYCVCSNYTPNGKEDQQYDNGTYFCYWGNTEQKAYFLSAALECFRARTEENYISKYRMEELASKAIDRLIEDDTDEASYYFIEEMEMEDFELEYFGLNENGYRKED